MNAACEECGRVLYGHNDEELAFLMSRHELKEHLGQIGGQTQLSEFSKN